MLRATLKSLLSRKLRLILSSLAVILGVMFVSGAFVLTNTLGRSFDQLFTGVYANTAVQVTAAPKLSSADLGADPQAALTIPASVVDQVRGVSGVASATGQVMVDGAHMVGTDGKVVTTTGAPRFGSDWTSHAADVELRQGRGPTTDTEVAINAALARAAGVKVGDQVGILTPVLRSTTRFTLVGIFGFPGGKDSIGGSQMIAFTLPVAQKVMLGATDTFSSIDVTAASGVTNDQLRDRVSKALGSGFVAKTGQQLTDESKDSFQKALSFFNNILIGFAGVALFVAIFLILNTFSIIVAQRTKELALMRAIGAGRRQVIGSVLTEAVTIGLLSAVVGLGLGIGVGALLAKLFSQIGGGGLELAGIGVPPAAVISAFAVGIGVTVLAALIPAMRASRIPPVAAMRDAQTTDKPLTKLTVAGGIVFGLGAILLAVGLTGNAGGNTLLSILGGVLLAFVGAALLTPIFAQPVRLVGTGSPRPAQQWPQPAADRDHRVGAHGRHRAGHRHQHDRRVGEGESHQGRRHPGPHRPDHFGRRQQRHSTDVRPGHPRPAQDDQRSVRFDRPLPRRRGGEQGPHAGRGVQ
jgi:putative ABC transport system permease protein